MIWIELTQRKPNTSDELGREPEIRKMIVDEIVKMQFNTMNRPEMQRFPPRRTDFITRELPEPNQIMGNNLQIDLQPNLPTNSNSRVEIKDDLIYSAQKFKLEIGSNFKQSQLISKFEVNPEIVESYQSKNKK